MELLFEGRACFWCGTEGVKQCSVVLAQIKGQEMVGAIVPGSTADGYCGRVPGRVAELEVALGFSTVGGLPLEEYLVNLML